MKIDVPKYLEVMISHSDSPIRDLYRSILNRCIAILIERREVKINDKEDQSEYKIKLTKLFDDILALIYTEVPKNSAKLHQYFEFWKVFSFSSR